MAATSDVNLLLADLPRKDRKKFLLECEWVDMTFDTVLCERDSAFNFVYFPLTGFISLLAGVDGHPPIEAGLIGNEGVLGASLTLGINTSPLHCVVQRAGTALRMTTPRFKKTLRDSLPVQRMANRSLYLLISQLSQSVACAHFHEVEPRLARWLLMIHDRAHSDKFYFTHGFLAAMLGVQRSAISIAAGSFQKRNLIQYSRGQITVHDRKGLEAAACDCYERIAADYRMQVSRKH